MKEWVEPKIIIGNKATGDYYYPRINLQEEIITEINKGNHILIADPRRFGKTSIMVHIVENCPENMKCIFENIQGINSEAEFYERFYELILNCLKLDSKIWKKINKYINGLNITEFSFLDGKLKFGNKKEINFLNEIDFLVPKLKEQNIKVVLFIDELPEVLYKLYRDGKGENASSLLRNIRRWRQNKQYEALCIVMAGSIGIHHIVKLINDRTTDINDLKSVKFKPFSYEEAEEYISHVTKEATIKYTNEMRSYLIGKVSYLIPYFINLLLNDIHVFCKKNNIVEIDEIQVDIIFDVIVKENKNFRDWKDRLFEYFEKDIANFMNKVLIIIAHENKISKRELYNLAVKHDFINNYMDFIDDLEKDGYIEEKENDYVFLSPFLKSYWKRNNPYYEK